ncbi:MAG TPA: patatin-like phospholipase family protein [Azonexus sp.]|nr:patatin-like phospholipase family protein [Azonexus sp.]
MSKALLVFQGGGALGAYQCGAYKAIAVYLRRAGIEVAGIAGASIGALNSAVVARHLGDADGGAGALEAFWREDLATPPQPFFPFPGCYPHCWNSLLSMLLTGNPGLCAPNYLAWSPWGMAWRARAALHDTGPMLRLLEKRVGSFGPNPGGYPLLLVRAVNAATQQPAVFHSWQGDGVTARHVVASSSVPVLYPLTDIDGQSYWDGDVLPHSPLRELLRVLRSRPGPEREIGDYLVIVVDTICGEGRKPDSGLDLLFQVQAALLAPRADSDEEYAAINNRYLDFLTECTAATTERTASDLERRVAREKEGALEDGLCRLNVIRIARAQALPYEYVSRDLDYSPQRINRLIEQGEQHAQQVLASRGDLATQGVALPP